MDGKKLRELREASYLSLAELAERAGLEAHTIWKLETGRSKSAQGRTVRKLADALNVDPSEIGGK